MPRLQALVDEHSVLMTKTVPGLATGFFRRSAHRDRNTYDRPNHGVRGDGIPFSSKPRDRRSADRFVEDAVKLVWNA